MIDDIVNFSHLADEESVRTVHVRHELLAFFYLE